MAGGVWSGGVNQLLQQLTTHKRRLTLWLVGVYKVDGSIDKKEDWN